jgi:hypothetical protein
VAQLGGDHDLVAVGEVVQRAAEDLLRRALRVDVGRVEEGDPGLEGVPDERAAALLVERPGGVPAGRVAEGHRAERYGGDVEAGRAELDVVHGEVLALGWRQAESSPPVSNHSGELSV